MNRLYSRRFAWNVKYYFLVEIKQFNFRMSSTTNLSKPYLLINNKINFRILSASERTQYKISEIALNLFVYTKA